ncbi:MAG: hypothetical protein VX265_05795 [Myxococcota bacterium]|nr:hypothetical protein [Myxococcota bacterium]MEC8422357.1 hypothetical protein [Myxococcota bacterium]
MVRALGAVGLGLLVCATGCSISSAQPPADGDPPRSGLERIAPTDPGGSCLRTCGVDARAGAYTDCLSSGKDQAACATSARVWYRDCIESRCTDAEVRLDDCRFACRAAGASAVDACEGHGAEADRCAVDARAETKACVAACG